jgi:hypothetical protein
MNMELVQWNVVHNGEVDYSPWGSPWVCSVERAIHVAERLGPDTQIWPAVPQELSLVEQIEAYARAHYDTGGWDVIVECWSPEQIEKALSVWGPSDTHPHQAATLEEAITKSTLASVIDVWADRQADAAVEGCTGDRFCQYHTH